MPGNPFLDPHRPVNGGLNRARVFDLPDPALTEEIAGLRGSRLLGAAALRELVRRRLPDLGDGDALHLLSHLLTAPDADRRRAAVDTALAIGSRLGALLLSLHLGGAAARAARPEWDGDHWAFWQGVRRVWLGGGAASGRLGEIIASGATALLQRSGAVDFIVSPSLYGERLSLLGAARLLPPEDGDYPVLDCGQTRIKLGRATVRDGAVVDVTPPTARPAPCPDLWLQEPDPLRAQPVWEGLVRLLASVVAAAPGAGRVTMGLALACRVRDGHPWSQEWMSCYGRLQLVSTHLATDLGAAVAAVVNRPVALRLVQDATAAALVYAGRERGVVLTLGTAIGTGYVPSADGLLPLRMVVTR